MPFQFIVRLGFDGYSLFQQTENNFTDSVDLIGVGVRQHGTASGPIGSFKTLCRKGRCRRNRFIVYVCVSGIWLRLLTPSTFESSVTPMYLLVQELEWFCRGSKSRGSYQLVNVATTLNSFSPPWSLLSGSRHDYEQEPFSESLISVLQ